MKYLEEFEDRPKKDKCGIYKGTSYITQKIIYQNENYAIISRKSRGFTTGEYTLIFDKNKSKKVSEILGSIKFEHVSKRVKNKLIKLGYE